MSTSVSVLPHGRTGPLPLIGCSGHPCPICGGLYILAESESWTTVLKEWVLQQKQGKFAVEFDGHCISWNTEKNYILETDPSYEAPPLSKTRLRTAATLVDAGSELGFDMRRRCLVLLYSQVRYSR